jgi:trehalose 6-phosphate synthase/phosphatase
VAEHGAWLKKDNRSWQPTEPLHDDWKQIIRPILELFTDRTPGSLVEEKDFSLVWHFRQSDSELAGMRIQELKDAILNLTANENLGIYEGNKILEIRHAAINKGKAAELFLTSESWAFILAAGDDYTDEDMFAVLPENAYSIKIRPGVSQAKYYVDSPKQLRELLDELSRK